MIPTRLIAIAFGTLLSIVFALAVADAKQTKAEAPIRAPSPTTRPDVVAGVDLSRVVIAFECANNGNKTPRGFDAELLAGGWDKFFASQVDPEIAWLKKRGAKRVRILLHNPYGLEGEGKNFAFSQRAACARNPETRHLADGLRRQLERVIADGVEPIVYVGAFGGDVTTATKLTVATLDEWLYSVREILDSRAAAGFDWSNDLPPSSAEYHFIQLCAGLTTVYREPRLRIIDRGNVISTDAFWLRTDPAVYADAKWALPNEAHDDVIRWLQYPDGDAGWKDRFPGDVAARLAAGARRVQADGDVAAVAPGWWRTR